MFDNINGYDDLEYSTCIPDAARKDCREAWKFANEIGFPLNFHIEIEIPSNLSEDDHPWFQRKVGNKLRVHADDNGFDAYQLMHRTCDAGTKANPRIDVLYYVAPGKEANFEDVVGKWSFVKAITPVTYAETTMPDGTVQSAFNKLFAALSPQFAADHPELPYKPSGPVLGDRTFYSRSLWAKHRFLFWKAKRGK